MENEDFMYVHSVEDYYRVVQVAGVRTTVSKTKFEVIAPELSDLWEQQVIELLRDWISWRKKNLRDPGDLPESEV